MTQPDAYLVAMAQILVEGGRALVNLDRAVAAIGQAAARSPILVAAEGRAALSVSLRSLRK